jgi:hypothetical protein
MSIYSLTCPDVSCYTNFSCDPEFQNKVVAVAFVKKSDALTVLEKASAAAWKSALLGRYASGSGFIVFNTSGEKPKPDTATTSGRGMQNTKALAKTHTLTYMDMQGVVQSNVQFYNEILATSQNYDFYYFTPGRIWDASGAYVTVIGDPVISADLNTYQQAEVSVTWISKVNPLPYEFDTDVFLEGLSIDISVTAGSDLTYNVVDACVEGGNSIINLSYDFSQPTTGGTGVVWSATASSGVTLAITAPYSDDTTLSWCTSVLGINTIYVTCTSLDGCIYGTLDISVSGL